MRIAKALIVVLCLLTVATVAAQTAPEAPLPTNVYAAGVSYNNGGSPSVSGTAMYARLVSASTNTYAFTALDILPLSAKPATVLTNIGVGIAQKVLSVNAAGRRLDFFVPTSSGVAVTGNNLGWNWTGGGMVNVPIKANWSLQPNVRFVKSSVSSGAGYQLIGGVMIGWGQ